MSYLRCLSMNCRMRLAISSVLITFERLGTSGDERGIVSTSGGLRVVSVAST